MAVLLNTKYFAAGKDRLRYLIREFESSCLARQGDMELVPMPNITALPVRQVEPAQGWTRTQMAELFRDSLNRDGEIIEAIQGIVSFSSPAVVLFPQSILLLIFLLDSFLAL